MNTVKEELYHYKERKLVNKKVECGICGEKYPVRDMIREEGSYTGYICEDCLIAVHPEFDIEEW